MFSADLLISVVAVVMVSRGRTRPLHVIGLVLIFGWTIYRLITRGFLPSLFLVTTSLMALLVWAVVHTEDGRRFVAFTRRS